MMDRLLAELLDRLRNDVLGSNAPGNIDGLLANHILGEDLRIGIDWSVHCDADWISVSYDPSSLPSVAALGYTLNSSRSQKLVFALEDGLQRAIVRDPCMAGQAAAQNNPAVLIGLILGAIEFRESSPHYLDWCAQVVNGLLRGMQNHCDPLIAYSAQLTGVKVPQATIDFQLPVDYLAALDWWCDTFVGSPQLRFEQRRKLREILVDRSLAEVIGHRSAHHAALLWRSIRLSIANDSSLLLTSIPTVSFLLSQFESCLRRWRWDSSELKMPVRWTIRSEREVQDILWLILRGTFTDLEDEETLPKFGHSTYRADFGIPSIGLLIEVKFARSAGDFKQIEKDIMEDIGPYLRTPERYKEVLVFIYDDSCSVQEHETTRQALKEMQGISDVIIVSRPSQLPDADSRAKWEEKAIGK